MDCFLQSIKIDEIICRLGVTNKTAGLSGKAIVFLKTSEEADCTASNNCQFNYTDSIPEVTGISTVWDETNQYWTVVVVGTDFSGSAATTELSVNGRIQTTVS